VARRDFEQSNLAHASPSRRSDSRDRTNAPVTPSRTDSTRSNHNTPSQPRHTRYASDGSNTNGTSRTAAVPVANPTRGRRTMIEASTGQWALGKTIGAGSMGKVKLAKNVETGEQVW
jgi:serine/threonine protein kinase KIN1/2